VVDTAGSIGSVGYFDITSVFLYGKFLNKEKVMKRKSGKI